MGLRLEVHFPVQQLAAQALPCALEKVPTKEKGKKGKLTISRTTFCLRISGQRHRCYMVLAQRPAADQYRCQCTCCRKVEEAEKVVATPVVVVKAAQALVIEIVLNLQQA